MVVASIRMLKFSILLPLLVASMKTMVTSLREKFLRIGTIEKKINK